MPVNSLSQMWNTASGQEVGGTVRCASAGIKLRASVSPANFKLSTEPASSIKCSTTPAFASAVRERSSAA